MTTADHRGPGARADRPDGGADDSRASAGVDHLQAAALEMIGAARAFLDVVEDVVSDRDKAAEIISVLTTVAETAVHAARGGVPDGSHRGEGGRAGGAGGPGRVQTIRVS